MGRRHDIDAHIGALGDIAKIVRAMRNLSYLETRKLTRFIEGQRHVVSGIDEAAHDFLDHHPALVQGIPDVPVVYVLIGAERPFCGNFNEGVLDALTTPAGAWTRVELIAVGARLASLLAGDPRLVDSLAGATAAEEVPSVLGALVERLNHLTAEHGPMRLQVLHWDAGSDRIEQVRVLPPFWQDGSPRSPRHAFAPRLNLAPAQFFRLLVEHYLFAALHALLYSSLLVEHRRRIEHLQGALGRIDDRIQALALTRNTLRQEEITEEIELILLGNGGTAYAAGMIADTP